MRKLLLLMMILKFYSCHRRTKSLPLNIVFKKSVSKYDVHFLGRITSFAKLQIHFCRKSVLNIQMY